MCVTNTERPVGSTCQYYMSVDVCYNFNSMVNTVLEDPEYQWLWILGDDHVWRKDLLLKLLDRNLDVVVPFCLRRTFPYHPILHKRGDDWDNYQEAWDLLKGKTGLFEWKGSTGNAGMLIRRHVIEAMAKDGPLFQNGKTDPSVGGSDLYFWHRLIEAGYKPVIDLENTIGHITHASVWPRYNPETETWDFQMTAP